MPVALNPSGLVLLIRAVWLTFQPIIVPRELRATNAFFFLEGPGTVGEYLEIFAVQRCEASFKHEFRTRLRMFCRVDFSFIAFRIPGLRFSLPGLLRGPKKPYQGAFGFVHRFPDAIASILLSGFPGVWF